MRLRKRIVSGRVELYVDRTTRLHRFTRDAYAYLPTVDYFSLCPVLLVRDKSYDSYTHIIATPYTEVRVKSEIA